MTFRGSASPILCKESAAAELANALATINSPELPIALRIIRREFVGALLAVFSRTPRTIAAPARSTAGTVLTVSGSCTAGKRKLMPGTSVQAGDAIDVPRAPSKLKLRMVDQSIICIAPGSLLTIVNYSMAAIAGQSGRPGGEAKSPLLERPAGRDVKLTLEHGLLRAVVAPVTGSSSFLITTPVGTASARSTDFFAEAKSGFVQIGVYDGTVDLTSTVTGRSVAISTRWGGRLEVGRDPMPPRLWAQAEFNDFISRTE